MSVSHPRNRLSARRSLASSTGGWVLAAMVLQALVLTILLGAPSVWAAVVMSAIALLAAATATWWVARCSASVVDEVRAQLDPDIGGAGSFWIGRCPRAREEAELVEALHALSARLDRMLERERELRRQAEDADRYKTAFLDSVSHELRTPLNSILGFAEILAQDIDGPLTPAQREDVEVILTSGRYLESLFTDVLDLSAMVSGRVELQREPVDAGRLVHEIAQMLEGQRRDRPVEIHTRIQPGLDPMAGDPRRVRQILANLASNALKFTEEGHVVLQAGRVDAGVRLSVRDTGAGIAADQLETIFEEFTQVEPASRRPAGSGLGLAICKRLVDLHGGRIEVESELRRGSTFHVILPAWRGSRS